MKAINTVSVKWITVISVCFAACGHLMAFSAPHDSRPTAVGVSAAPASGTRDLTDDLDNPCDSPSEPPPAYKLPTYDARQIKTMLTTPQNVGQLLSNLKVVLDQSLLAQRAFFDDAVLLTTFKGAAVNWVEPGTLDIAFDWVIKPTHKARITLSENTFPEMKVDLGWNHKCLNRRPDPRRPGEYIPPHTYDAGYIRLRFKPIEGFTIGAVRRVFGQTRVSDGFPCEQAPTLSYAGPGAGADVFYLNQANFYADATVYQELCRSRGQGDLPDELPITDVWLRLSEQDYSIQEPLIY